MKISEIKSEEVRNEAVRLYMKERFVVKKEKEALNNILRAGFIWNNSPQGHDFWSYLNSGTTPNTPDLKLPNL